MKIIKHSLIYFLLSIFCFLIISPVILVVLLSLQDSLELSKTVAPLVDSNGNFVDIDWIPLFPTLAHFQKLLLETPEFYIVFWNSLGNVACILLFQVLVSVPAAWAFARFRFRGKALLFHLYVILMLMPFQVTMLSQYLVLDQFHVLNTRWAMILPAIFSTFPVFLIYRGFADIPRDILDSARIDGANEWRVLYHMGIPLGKQGILACIILSFLDYWNMVEQPLAFLKDKRLFPLSLYLPMLDFSQAAMILSASVITLIPAFFVFLMGQSYLEQGIIASALKE